MARTEAQNSRYAFAKANKEYLKAIEKDLSDLAINGEEEECLRNVGLDPSLAGNTAISDLQLLHINAAISARKAYRKVLCGRLKRLTGNRVMCTKVRQDIRSQESLIEDLVKIRKRIHNSLRNNEITA